MPTMNISLTPEMADFAAGELKTGDYASASEAVRDALGLLRRDHEIKTEKTAILKREVSRALVQADAGEFSERSVMDIAADVLRESKV